MIKIFPKLYKCTTDKCKGVHATPEPNLFIRTSKNPKEVITKEYQRIEYWHWGIYITKGYPFRDYAQNYYRWG